jgi:Ca2+-binding EF-hand superfamily protein
MMATTAEDFLSSKSWCYKMEAFVFKKADIDGDGYISEEDRKSSQTRFMDYAQKQGVDKTALEANNAATESYISTFGTGSDRVSREDWLKRVAEIAAADQERIKRGEEPILVKNAGPFFDVMDTDKDGSISLEDFKLGYGAIGWDAVSAEYAFKALDKNNSGKIGREEI